MAQGIQKWIQIHVWRKRSQLITLAACQPVVVSLHIVSMRVQDTARASLLVSGHLLFQQKYLATATAYSLPWLPTHHE